MGGDEGRNRRSDSVRSDSVRTADRQLRRPGSLHGLVAGDSQEQGLNLTARRLGQGGIARSTAAR
jgi:hypothetical protein